MIRWSLLGVGAAWASAMLYEWLWTGGQSPWLLAMLAAGVFLAAAAFVYTPRRGRARVRPMVWFVLAAVAVALWYAALESTVEKGLSHVPMLPLYPILFLDFLASGCYTWWRRRGRRK